MVVDHLQNMPQSSLFAQIHRGYGSLARAELVFLALGVTGVSLSSLRFEATKQVLDQERVD